MSNARQTRRDFLKWAAAGAAAVDLAGGRRTAAAQQPATRSIASRPSPNERIVLGFIGLGGMGSGLLHDFMKQPDVEVAACCDVYRPHVARAVEWTQGKAQGYEDFRRVLDRKDIDAVVVATPDHWHAIPTIRACEAGKDVYHEKPLAHNIREGRLMANAAAKHKRITQMGTQIHAGENYRRVVEIVQSGALGEIHKCRAWECGNLYPAGRGRSADARPPADLNYDFWLGPAPQRPYNKCRSHFVWRYYWDYGGGVLGDMGCHLIDVIFWALDLHAPTAVTAAGGKLGLEDDSETPDSLDVTWEFDPPPGRRFPLTLTWTHSSLSSEGFFGRSMGVAFYGTMGTLVADYGTRQMLPQKGHLDGWTPPPPSIPPSPGHHREFLDAIRTRQPCSCHMERSHRLTTMVHLGNVAYRSGRRLRWDATSETFVGDAEANRLLSRDYRKPWEL